MQNDLTPGTSRTSCDPALAGRPSGGAPQRPATAAKSSRLAGQRWLAGLLMTAGLAVSGCGGSNPMSTLIVSWDVASAADPAATKKCSEVGISNIIIDAGAGGTGQFPCSSFGAETFAFPAGNYNLQIIALDSAGHILQAISFPNYYVFGQTRLPAIHFIIK
jgi:hypothetical protein